METAIQGRRPFPNIDANDLLGGAKVMWTTDTFRISRITWAPLDSRVAESQRRE